MASEIAGAVASVRLLWDVVTANKQLVENRELVTAVSKVNTDLMSAQSVALDAQQRLLALTKEKGELEQKIVALENWDREAERYALRQIAGGVYAYQLKPGMEQGEDPHSLCQPCFDDRKKSVLQAGPRNMGMGILRCVRCNATYFPGGSNK